MVPLDSTTGLPARWSSWSRRGTGARLQREAVAGPTIPTTRTGRAQSTARATRRGTRRAHRRPVVRYHSSLRSPSCSVHRWLHRRWVSDGSGSSPTGRQQPRRDGRQGEQRPSLAGRGTGHPTPDGDPDGAFHELLHLRPGCVGADREHRPRTRRRRWGSARYASAPALERDGCLPRRRRQDRPIRGQTACDGDSRPWDAPRSIIARAYSAFPQVSAVWLRVLSARAPEKILDRTLPAQDQLFGPPRGLAWGSPSDLGTPVGGPPLATRLTITVPLSDPSRGDVLFSRIRSLEAARWKYPRS